MRTVFFLITAIVFSTAGVFAGELDLDLKRILDETDPGDRVKVIAYLSDSLDGRSITLEHDAMSLPANKRNKNTIVRLMNKAEETQGPLLAKLIGDQKTGDVAMIRPFWIANAIAFEATPERIQEVVRRDDIEIIYFDYPIELIEPVSKRPVIHPIGRGAVENGVAAIRADEVWDLGFDGTGITVGVMDTGVDGNHPALTNWAGNDSDYEGNPGWAFHDPVTGQTFPFDSGSHGTHTTGTVCGQGGIGVAPGARYIHSAVIDRVSIEQTITDAIAAFEWFVNPDGDPNTSWDAPVVISNSWGLAPFFGYPECSDIFWSVIDNCEAANIVVVFAAGNEGSSPTTLRSPADRATTPYTTFAVAALDGNDPSYPAAGFSSRGPSYCGPNGEESIKPDIAAPGVDVSSSVPGSGYSNFSGTSMACPHVAGTVALLRQAAPALTVDQVKQAIYDSAVDLGEPGEDNTYGHGIVDAFEAVQIGLSTVLSLTPFDPVTIHKSVLGGPVEPSEVVYILENPTDEDTGYIVERTEVGFELLLNGGPGPLKGKLPAGTSVSFTVSIGESYLDLPAGIYNSQFRVTSTTTDIEYNRTHRLELGITDFDITPDYGLEAGGPIGGPFAATQVYQMIGTEPTPVEIRISASEEWISVNGSNDATVTLAEGETADVIVGFSETANQLNNGLYQGEIAITNLTTPNNGDDTRPVILDVGRFTYVATDTPIDIVDNSELTSYVNVPDAYCVGDVNVEVDITHTFIGDLIVDLISPEGTAVRLHDRQGGSDDNIEGSYDDEGGDLIPFEPLASVDGEIVSGTWALRISDNAGADQGSLNSWKLKIASSGEICPPVAFDQEISIDENATVDVVLEGASPLGEDLSFVITALPNEGSLLDGSTPITSTPTTLMGDTVNYTSAPGYVGLDDFRFRTQDSNATSEEATVLVNVGVIPYPDECSSAELVFNGSWDISTLKATSSSDPYDDAQCTGTYLGEMNQDIWLEYEACASGSITVSTCSTIDFDSDLVMYEGSCSDLQQVACNGDGSGCSNYSSIMQGDVTEGSIYLIRVGGWSDSSAGSGTIDITGPEGECASPCPADLTGDGVVNTLDLLQLVSSFGSCPGCAEDFNQDGVVNTFDLLEMVSAFGSCD